MMRIAPSQISPEASKIREAGFMLGDFCEAGILHGLGAYLVREVLGQDHVAETNVPLRARIVLPQHEDHDDDCAVDFLRRRIVPHPGPAEMV